MQLIDDVSIRCGAQPAAQAFALAGAAFEVGMRVAAAHARLVVIGFASGTRPMVPANILLVKNIDVIGFYFGRYIWDGVVPRLPWDRQVADAFVSLFGWYEAGAFG